MFVVCVPLGRSESGWCGSKSKNTRELNHTASEVQGERRAELARALLSRSLHSPSQLVCGGKSMAKNNALQFLGTHSVTVFGKCCRFR